MNLKYIKHSIRGALDLALVGVGVLAIMDGDILSNVKIALFAALDFADEMSQLGNNTLDKDAIKALSDLSDSLASAIQED